MITRNRLLLGALAVALVLSGWLSSRQKGSRSPADREDSAAIDRVRSFAAAVTSFRAQQARRPIPRFDPTKERLYRSLAEQPTDVKSALKNKDWRWSPTVLAIEDPGWVSSGRLECDRNPGKEIASQCNYQIDMVLERTAKGTGRIVFSRARVLDDTPEPICPYYSECIAQARMNEELPLPPDGFENLAIAQKVNTGLPNPAMLDPDRTFRTIGLLKGRLEQMKQQADLADPAQIHEIRRHEAIIRYAEKRNEERRAELATAKGAPSR